MKTCTKCKEELPLDHFTKVSKSKSGLNSSCKACHKKQRSENVDRIKEYAVKYREKNKEHLNAKHKLYWQHYKNKPKEKIENYTCHVCNIEKSIDNYSKDTGKKFGINTTCKKCIKVKSAKYYESNKEYLSEKAKLYAKNNKPKLRSRSKEYRADKKKKDPLYRLECNIRRLILLGFEKLEFTKESKTFKILGIDRNGLRKHIEDQFEPFMTWENRGGKGLGDYGETWDIDHIIPLSTANNEEDLIRLNHYTNLRPLCSRVNRVDRQNKTF